MIIKIVGTGAKSLTAIEIQRLLSDKGMYMELENILINEDVGNGSSTMVIGSTVMSKELFNELSKEYIKIEELTDSEMIKEKTNYFEREKSLRFLNKARRR